MDISGFPGARVYLSDPGFGVKVTYNLWHTTWSKPETESIWIEGVEPSKIRLAALEYINRNNKNSAKTSRKLIYWLEDPTDALPREQASCSDKAVERTWDV